MVHPYAENSRKRLTKTPKLYFYDTGLACYLLGIENETQLSSDRMRGHLFENLVVADMVKRRAHEGKSTELMFYRDSNGNEIDLLVPVGQALE
jgi:predicted AAA+ superfamily ATPase